MDFVESEIQVGYIFPGPMEFYITASIVLELFLSGIGITDIIASSSGRPASLPCDGTGIPVLFLSFGVLIHFH